jgi:hypothetical protein
MKKLLLSAIVLIAMSCSSNDESSSSNVTDPITTDCDCGRIVRSGAFNVVNTPGSPTPTTTFTTYVVLNNCSNLERTYQVSGNQTSTYPVGKYICN